MQHATFQSQWQDKKTNPSPIKSICWWNCWEITGCQTWDKCSSAAQCLGRLKRGWVSVTHGAQPEVIWHGTWRRTVQFWTPKWHEASRSYRHAMVIGFRWFAMCFLYLLIPSWLRTQWSVPRGPWQFAQNPSLPVIDPAAGCCPLYPPYTLQSCGAIWAVFFFVVWVRLLLCCLRHCLCNAYAATVGAYAAHPFEGVPTQAQRPHKATPQCMFLPTPSHFCLLLEGWKRNFCLRDHSPIHIFAARAPRLQSAHRHLAATPMQQPHQQPGPKAHTKHLVDKSW